MFDEIKKIGVFLIRDFRMFFTYKLAFTVTVLSLVFNFFYLVLFGSMFGSANLSSLPSAYGGNFISYILVGSIGWGFLWSVIGATGTSLRNEMMMGTLESVLLTPTKIYTIMFSYALFGCFFGLLSIIVLMLIGVFCFGLSAFATANIFTLLIFIFSLAMMMGLGMIFSGLTIWLKSLGEMIPLLQNIVTFFCGVYFPISILPTFFQPVANFMPFYYSIEGLRKSLIPSTPLSEMLFYVGVLLSLSIFFIAVGLIVLKKGLIKAKKDGSLAFY